MAALFTDRETDPNGKRNLTLKCSVRLALQASIGFYKKVEHFVLEVVYNKFAFKPDTLVSNVGKGFFLNVTSRKGQNNNHKTQ